MSHSRSSRPDFDPRPAPDNPDRRRVGTKRTLPTARTHLPHVEALHIVALVQQHNLVCVFLPSLLYHSSGYIRAGWRDRPRCWRPHRCSKCSSAYSFSRSWPAACRVKLDDDATFAERWACAYPALVTTFLPKGRVWFACSVGRWVHS